MPATSKAQQRLMGMAYALKKGEMKRADASDEVKDLADGMTLKQLKDYAETSHEGLPDKVEESSLTGFFSAGPLVRYSTYPANISSSWRGIIKDRSDPYIQTFLDFISQKDDDEEKDANEGDVIGFPGVASPQGTPGMGNVSVPSAGNVGSGDRFDNGSADDDEEGKVGLMSYEDYKKWIEKWQKQKRQR